jgi:putative lipoic acid-binding regulatory protein
VRDSRGGNYLSVTVTIRAESRAQLDAIYRDLTGDERVLMAL